MKSRKSKKVSTELDVTGSSFSDRLVFTVLVGTCVLVAVSSFFPGVRLWGINHLAFYPRFVRVIAILLIAVALIPPINRWAYGALISVVSRLRSKTQIAGRLTVVLAISALVVFFGLRTSTYLLGDGQLIANSLENRLEKGTDMAEQMNWVTKNERISPGASMVYVVAAQLVTQFPGVSPASGIVVVNILIGTILVLILLTVARRHVDLPPLALWFLMLTLSSGAIQLYFGYVEDYPPFVFLGSLYVLSGFTVVKSRMSFWVPFSFALVAIYIHIEGLLLLPSLVGLTLWRFGGMHRVRWLHAGTPAILGLTVLITIAACIWTPLSRFYLPLAAPHGASAVLSLSHGLDVLNEMMLLLPTFPLIVALGLSAVLRRRANSGRTSDNQQRVPEGEHSSRDDDSTRIMWHLSFLVFVPALFFLILFDSEIGVARDWDLFTILVLGMIPLAFLTINHLSQRKSELLARLVVPAAVMSMVLTASWVGINASFDRSVARFEQILSYDTRGAGYAYETLARTYRAVGRISDATRNMKNARDLSSNPRYGLLLARYYREGGSHEDAVSTLQELLTVTPEHLNARKLLILYLTSDERHADVEKVAREGIRIQPRFKFYYQYLGNSLIKLGQEEEGRDVLRQGRLLDLGPQ